MRNGPEREAMFLRPLVAVKRIVEEYAREHGTSLNTAASALIVDGAMNHGMDTSDVDVAALLIGESPSWLHCTARTTALPAPVNPADAPHTQTPACGQLKRRPSNDERQLRPEDSRPAE